MTLKIQNLNYKTILKEISLEFKPGILYGILGPNGAGKSTLLKATSRIWTPTTGQVHWNETDLLQISRQILSRIISLVPQNPSLFFDCPVDHMVAMGLYARGLRGPQADLQIEEALSQVDGLHLRHKMISQLSGGERQRIYIARSLATQSPVLLLDEPTSYLDLRHQLEIWNLLHQLVKNGKLVIVALHDFTSARRFCDELVILHQGKCHAQGPYSQVMTPQLLQEVFGVELLEADGVYRVKG